MPTLTVEEVHRGLLLGLAEHCRKLRVDGSLYYAAYQRAMVSNKETSEWAMEEWDPAFGVHRGAERMLAEGMRDLILALDSITYQTAFFTISAAQAKKELDELPHSEVYRDMASAFLNEAV